MRLVRRYTWMGLCVLPLACKDQINTRSSNVQSINQASQSPFPSGLPQEAQGFRSLVAASQVVRPGTVIETTESDVKAAINADAEFYDNSPNSSSGCSVLADAMPVKATDKTIIVEGTVDAKSCFASGQSGVTVSEAKAEVVIQFYCEQGKFAGYNGKKSKDVEDVDCPGGQSQILSSSIFSAKYSVTQSGDTANIDMKMYTLFGKVDTTPCSAVAADKATEFKYNDCVSISRTDFSTTVDSKTEATSEYSILKFKDVAGTIGAKDGTYHKSGVVEFEYNDWLEGKMTYTSPNTAPTFTIKKGGTTASGTYTYSDASLALAGEQVRKLWYKFKIKK